MGINVTDDLTQSDESKKDIQVRCFFLFSCYGMYVYVCMCVCMYMYVYFKEWRT